MDTIQGREVDSFLDMRKSADYLECFGCGHIEDMPRELPKDWRFSLMGFVPSKFLKTIRGLCPRCQAMRKDFKGLLDRMEA